MNSLIKLRHIISKVRPFCRLSSTTNNIYEPDYLHLLKSKVPLYDTINIQMRGHDYAILENYQKLVHNMAKNMDIDVEDAWAVPAQDMQITTYKENSEVINSQYSLKTYERSVQITDVSSLKLPILLRALEASTPMGVSIAVVNHEDYHEEVRYIPDKELLELKQELDEMGGPRKVR
ncbi:PREDICTED: uncharacterized protein LOC108568025 [Nicrophorus vespilloides]|uniref:Uncharacterized protein LOC108568025 n=1 Tax=Nicrophorus vespilloides TaxID=110193 RepID=A0ABM1NC11_NICVS|nr:PREDICTED: uncharacterized protein LOC108568025 [Nicrophorus vespilloides]